MVESTRAEGTERLAPGDSRQRRKTRQSKVSNEGLAHRALREWRPLAEQGNANAQFFLGVMYDKGQGVRQDLREAARWFRKAAEQGVAEAQSNLGFMYGYGEGVPQDYAQAYMWYDLAASRFPPGEGRDIAVKNRDIVAAKMTQAQIAEAQKLAREWKPKK